MWHFLAETLTNIGEINVTVFETVTEKHMTTVFNENCYIIPGWIIKTVTIFQGLLW